MRKVKLDTSVEVAKKEFNLQIKPIKLNGNESISFLFKLIEINNPSLEPEVLETINFLKVMGININVKDNTIYAENFKEEE